jgi:hypothetical protein
MAKMGQSNNNKQKYNNQKHNNEKFEDATKVVSTYEDIIDTLSVSPSAGDRDPTKSLSWQDQLNDYVILVLKYAFMVVLLTLNFLGLSVSLNCNADQELATRILSAIFAFFFGFVYLIVNYYTYKVMTQGKMCKMNREKLFPFKV